VAEQANPPDGLQPPVICTFGTILTLAGDSCTIVRMKIVADTNIFIAVALNEPEKNKIIQLTEGCDLIAPEVLPFEVGNVLSAMAKKNILDTKELISAWEMVQRIPVELRHVDIKSALEIALKFNIYAYDAYFLECAVSLRSPLITLDRGMKRVASNLGITILE
jgi:predicted nucleic acid-binding protein